MRRLAMPDVGECKCETGRPASNVRLGRRPQAAILESRCLPLQDPDWET